MYACRNCQTNSYYRGLCFSCLPVEVIFTENRISRQKAVLRKKSTNTKPVCNAIVGLDSYLEESFQGKKKEVRLLEVLQN